MSALALGAVGCQKAQDGHRLDEINQKLDRIAAQLDRCAQLDKCAQQLEKCVQAADSQRPAFPRPSEPDPAKVYSISIEGAAVKGPADALVTIVESADFQCPYCRRASLTLKQVEEAYGEEVRLAFLHNPLAFHDRALPAAIAVECAGEQGKFWEYHDKLFGEKPSLGDATLEKHARDVGIAVGEWKACLSSGKPRDKIVKQQRQAITMGARGTPAFFINGRFLSGARPFEQFKALIDEELKKARESGVARGEYYQKQVVEKGEKEI